MDKKSYFECIFLDGTIENFNKLCTKIDEFGKSNDMVSFNAHNSRNGKFVVLQVIPKSQIKQIVSHYSESDIKEVFG